MPGRVAAAGVWQGWLGRPIAQPVVRSRLLLTPLRGRLRITLHLLKIHVLLILLIETLSKSSGAGLLHH